MGDDKVKVLYIGGYSRSGSTLLLRMLGRAEGFQSVGELWDIWHRSFQENHLCGCGKTFRDCEFWQAVVAEAFGSLQTVDVRRMADLRRAVQSNRRLSMLMLSSLRTQQYRAHLREYANVLSALYRAIHKVSGSKVIVDSSKVAPYASVLKEVPEIDLSIVHLVRDSRATAYSWQRKKVRPEIHWKTAYMDRYSPTRSATEWNVYNALLQSLKYSGAGYMLTRYEDLVEDPREVLGKIGDMVGQHSVDRVLSDRDRHLQLGIDHTVSGNPMRFERSEIRILPDDEWRVKMPHRQKLLVTALTFPLLLRYGYVGFGSGDRAESTRNRVPG